MGSFVNSIVHVLAHPFIEFVAIPILVTILAVVLKCVVRGGSASKLEFTREDWLVGFDLGVAALLTLVVSSVKAVERYRALLSDLQRATNAKNDEVARELEGKTQQALDYLTVAPTFTFIALVVLVGLALLAGQRAWVVPNAPAQGATKVLVTHWIVGCDLVGFGLLAGALALGGLIR